MCFFGKDKSLVSKDLRLSEQRVRGRPRWWNICTENNKNRNIKNEGNQSKAVESKNNTITDFMVVIIVSNIVSNEYSFIS